MFVQVLDESATYLLPALPDSVQEASFDRLLAGEMVEVSGKVKAGKLVDFSARCDREQNWVFKIPANRIDACSFPPEIISSEREEGSVLVVECLLRKGENHLIG